MTLGGFCFMAGSWLVILGVFTYTMVRTLRGRGARDASPQTGPSTDG